MARRLRYVPTGSLFEVSNRTIQGRFLLKPTPQFTEIVYGILARAQALYGMIVHAFVFLSDHYHMLVSPVNAKQLADFMGYVDGNLAKEACRLYGWKDKVWADRYRAIQVSDEESVQLERLEYILSNGSKEGLVQGPREWKGATSTCALLDGTDTIEGVWYDRTKEYRARQVGKDELFPEVQTLHLTPLPCMESLPKAERMERYAKIVQAIEAETSKMHANRGTSPLGMNEVLRTHPHHTPRELKRSPAPMFLAASRRVLRDLKTAYDIFLQSYRQAAQALKEGKLDAEFPEGSFPPPRPFVEAFTPG